ncbi:hypothetical protein IWQ61_001309 [Dispira simplex]|nr:hypothetical protein IWQ61_001309 [Dispira simplex]
MRILMRPQILEMERLRREPQATKGELHAKDIEPRTGRQELQVRDTTISALEKKVKKVMYEKNRDLQTAVGALLNHRDSVKAIVAFQYKCRYDGVMFDLRTRLEEAEEAYLDKCRALDAVTAEYSRVATFANSSGTIPPPNEPTLTRILMEYQEEKNDTHYVMARGLLHGVQMNKIPAPTPPAPSLPPHKPDDLDLDYAIHDLDCRIAYASNFFQAQNRSIRILGRYVTALKAYVMEHAK